MSPLTQGLNYRSACDEVKISGCGSEICVRVPLKELYYSTVNQTGSLRTGLALKTG